MQKRSKHEWDEKKSCPNTSCKLLILSVSQVNWYYDVKLPILKKDNCGEKKIFN